MRTTKSFRIRDDRELFATLYNLKRRTQEPEPYNIKFVTWMPAKMKNSAQRSFTFPIRQIFVGWRKRRQRERGKKARKKGRERSCFIFFCRINTCWWGHKYIHCTLQNHNFHLNSELERRRINRLTIKFWALVRLQLLFSTLFDSTQRPRTTIDMIHIFRIYFSFFLLMTRDASFMNFLFVGRFPISISISNSERENQCSVPRMTKLHGSSYSYDK